MKLLVSQLHEGENSLQFDVQKDSWMKEVARNIEKQGYRLGSVFSVDITLLKLEPDYYLKGHFQFALEQTCARCAEPFSHTLNPKFDIAFAHMTSKRATPQLSDESEEVDINFFEGNEIDLGPVITEQFFLSLPYQAVCSASCKGICQSCGQNLNTSSCNCASESAPNSFSVLKNYKV
jgi:uncharacterized protein